MARLGNWWVSKHEALPGESVQHAYNVNYLRQTGRPLGGKLYLTDRRLLFSPHKLDAVLGGERTTIELDSVVDVSTLERGTGPEDEPGRSADRLLVECADDSTHSFVVGKPETVADEIVTAITERGAHLAAEGETDDTE